MFRCIARRKAREDRRARVRDGRDETNRDAQTFGGGGARVLFYRERASVSRPALRHDHSDGDEFFACSALAFASANAFFFAADTLGITAPGFFLASGSSYFLSR